MPVPKPRHLLPGLLAAALLLAPGGRAAAQSALYNDPFYSDPGPVSYYPSGAVIRYRDEKPDAFAPFLADQLSKVVRVMYRSQSAPVTGNTPIAATELIFVPKGRPPSGGWPVVVWTHGTTGINPACAPSKSPTLGPNTQSFYDAFVARLVGNPNASTYMVVAVDYQGLGIAGQMHPYLELDSEALTAIDGLRAARSLGVSAGARWLVVGHSQGGQAALGTGELAATRAPTLKLVGVAAIAPAILTVDLFKTLTQPINNNVWDYFNFIATSIKLSDPGFKYTEFLGPDLMSQLERTQTSCHPVALPPFKVGLNPDFANSRPVLAFLKRNLEGQRPTPAPILLISGGQDLVVPADLVAQMQRRLQRIGDKVEYVNFPTFGHNELIIDETSYRRVLDWIAGRFNSP